MWTLYTGTAQLCTIRHCSYLWVFLLRLILLMFFRIAPLTDIGAIIYAGISTIFMMTPSNGKIFRVTGPLRGESTGNQCFPLPKASDAGLWCFLWYVPEQMVEQAIETTLILDAIVVIIKLQLWLTKTTTKDDIQVANIAYKTIWCAVILLYCKTSNRRRTKPQDLNVACSCLYPIHWTQVLRSEWRCNGSSADRRVINNFAAYWGAYYIRGLTVSITTLYISLHFPREIKDNDTSTYVTKDHEWQWYLLPVYNLSVLSPAPLISTYMLASSSDRQQPFGVAIAIH